MQRAEEEGGEGTTAAADSGPGVVGLNRSINTLMDVSLKVKKGGLVAVIGPVGR